LIQIEIAWSAVKASKATNVREVIDFGLRALGAKRWVRASWTLHKRNR
jgi:hypothetical protein